MRCDERLTTDRTDKRTEGAEEEEQRQVEDGEGEVRPGYRRGLQPGGGARNSKAPEQGCWRRAPQAVVRR